MLRLLTWPDIAAFCDPTESTESVQRILCLTSNVCYVTDAFEKYIVRNRIFLMKNTLQSLRPEQNAREIKIISLSPAWHKAFRENGHERMSGRSDETSLVNIQF